MARRGRGQAPELTSAQKSPREKRRQTETTRFSLAEAPTVGALGRSGDAGATAHYADAAYYDHAYRTRHDDVAYYVRLGRLFGGPVLEYGIGTGRIAVELARHGVDVVGVDSAPEMLRGLERRLANEKPEVVDRILAVQGDMRHARLGRRFPLVIAPFNVVQHLYDRRDVELFLARVREHLRPSGRFVFDVLSPDPRDLTADPKKRFRAPRFRHPSTGGIMRYAERFEYDALRQVLLMSLEFEPEDGSPAFAVPLTHRQFFPGELEALLHYNGFSDIQIVSGSGEGPNVLEDSYIVTCRLGPEGRGRPTGPAKKSRRAAPRRASVAKRPRRA